MTEEQDEAEHEGTVTLSIFAAGLRKPLPLSPLLLEREAPPPAAACKRRARGGALHTHAHAHRHRLPPAPSPVLGLRLPVHTLWREGGQRRGRGAGRGCGGRARVAASRRDGAEAQRAREIPSPFAPSVPTSPPPSAEPFQPPSRFSFLPPWQWLLRCRLGRLRMQELGKGTGPEHHPTRPPTGAGAWKGSRAVGR